MMQKGMKMLAGWIQLMQGLLQYLQWIYIQCVKSAACHCAVADAEDVLN